MAELYKVIGQSNPTAATLTDIYTVPASTEAVVSTILIANRSSVQTTYRISIAVAGAVDSSEQYISYDVVIKGNGLHEITTGATLNATDKVRVYATLATLSFNVFGTEIS
jgi:hypothetical protein